MDDRTEVLTATFYYNKRKYNISMLFTSDGSIRNRPEWAFGCRTGSCRISIYYPVSRILPDQNRFLEGKIYGSRNLPETFNLHPYF